MCMLFVMRKTISLAAAALILFNISVQRMNVEFSDIKSAISVNQSILREYFNATNIAADFIVKCLDKEKGDSPIIKSAKSSQSKNKNTPVRNTTNQTVNYTSSDVIAGSSSNLLASGTGGFLLKYTAKAFWHIYEIYTAAPPITLMHIKRNNTYLPSFKKYICLLPRSGIEDSNKLNLITSKIQP